MKKYAGFLGSISCFFSMKNVEKIEKVLIFC